MDYKSILNLGVEKEIINETQKESLIDLFNQNSNDPGQISIIVKIFYYFGGLIMLSAMSWLMSYTVLYNSYATILLLGGLYAIAFLFVGEFLWRKNEKLPAKILYFLFISTVGFIMLDIEKMIGFFPHFSDMEVIPNYWDLCRLPVVVLSVLTIIANTILQKYRQSSILGLITIFCVYAIYLSIVDWIYGWENINDNILFHSNLIFGIGLIIVGFVKDRTAKVDYSQWLYFFGATGTFMSLLVILGLNYVEPPQIQLIAYILSIIYIFIGQILKRKTFSIIGVLGFIEYILYLEAQLLEGYSTILACIVIVTGLIILYLGVIYNKNVDKIDAFCEKLTPQKVKKFLPQNRH